MAFITEEGEGLSNGVVYFSHTDFIGYIMKDYFFYEEFYKEDNYCVLTEPEIMRAGVSACKELDKLNWSGQRARVHQNMEWPRKNCRNKCSGNNCVPPNIIPKEIKEAAIIMTALILKGEVQSGTNSVNPKIKSMSLGKMKIEFKDGARLDPNSNSCGGGVSAISGDKFHSVRHLIECFTGCSSANVKFVRGY